MAATLLPPPWRFQSAPANYGGRIAGDPPSPPVSKTFQSAPANYGGRINAGSAGSALRAGFNPRPPITAGESLMTPDNLQRYLVSIRARQLRRANPDSHRPCIILSEVSIRARQLRRANQPRRPGRAASW